jgi:hypothetical protein
MRPFRKYEKVTPEMIERCTKDLEFYDKYGYFPFDSKIKVWILKNRELILIATAIFLMFVLALRGFEVI